MRHTRGTWSIDERPESTVIEDSDGNEIAVLDTHRGRVEQAANARLIAQAPNMLLACQGALTALLLGPHVDQEMAIHFLKETLAACQGPTEVKIHALMHQLSRPW